MHLKQELFQEMDMWLTPLVWWHLLLALQKPSKYKEETQLVWIVQLATIVMSMVFMALQTFLTLTNAQ
jgi:hypothetical protein